MKRIEIGRLPVDVVDMAQAIDRIEALIRAGDGGTIFTPNVDHVVLAEQFQAFRQAYERVSLSLVDGMPLLWTSRLLGTPLPEKISGSDLVEPLLERAALRGFRVYLLGGGPGVAEIAVTKLKSALPDLQVVGTDAPRVAADGQCQDLRAVLGRLQAAQPDLVLVAFGTPKAELFCDANREALRPAICASIGATVDFIAGTVPRAPRWMSNAGVEWLYRLAREPRRLAYRYLVRDPQFLWIAARQVASRVSNRTAVSRAAAHAPPDGGRRKPARRGPADDEDERTAPGSR